MKPTRVARFLLVAAAAVTVAGVALVANQAQPAGAQMTAAAAKFLAALSPDQKKQATFALDDPHRLKWYFTPQQDKDRRPTRKGVRLDQLDAAQKAAALDLLKAGLSGKGFDQATTIMSLENILLELEGPQGAMVRNPNWYFVSVFGEPSNTGTWGWRVEGHHLSVNVTLDKGQVASPTPLLFGANPAEVRDGPRKGLRTLPDIEDLAKQLIQSLDDDQRKLARQAKQMPEIKEGQPDAAVGPPVGLAAGKMTDAQRGTLVKLLEAYAGRMPAEVAKAELDRVRAAGVEKVHFAYAVEEDKPGKPYSYRVQGPTFVVEFLNVQADGAKNPANHIHSGWRQLPADLGAKAG